MVPSMVDHWGHGIATFGWNRTDAGQERHLFSAPESGRKRLQAIRQWRPLHALITPTVSHRATIVEPKAVGALLRAIDGFEGHAVTRYALKLAPLVFVRPGELRQAEWAEFDLAGAE
jgi:integrase